MKPQFLLFTSLMFTAFAVKSQNYIDLAKFDYAVTSTNTFDTGTATTPLMEMNGDLTVPVVINEKFTFLPGVTYENTKASFDPGRATESITGLTLKLGMNINHNEKWSGTYILLPKISSDLKETNAKDFQMGAVVLMKNTKSERLNYKYGVYVNTDLFGPLIVPIFGIYYLNPTEKFEAKLLLPFAADFNYKVKNNFRYGLTFKGQVRTYNLNTPLANENNRYLARSTNEVYTYVQYALDNGINFQLGVGRSIGRSYRIYNERTAVSLPLVYFGDERKQLNTDFSDSWLFKATVFYRLNLSN
jgi:hypothetical protein